MDEGQVDPGLDDSSGGGGGGSTETPRVREIDMVWGGGPKPGSRRGRRQQFRPSEKWTYSD